MIALVLAGVLATSAVVDTTVRVPGTSLRFGMESSLFGAAQGFSPSTEQIRPGRTGRDGVMRFFGIDSRATLQFENRHLVEADFVIEQASPRQISYIEDDLRRRGYRERCVQDDGTVSVCDWDGRVQLRLEIEGSNLAASIRPKHSIFTWEAAETDTGPTLSLLPRDTTDTLVHPDTLSMSPSSQGGRPPDLLRVPGKPQFPEAARRAGVQGVVTVLALVDTTGDVMDMVIRRGVAELNDAALAVADGYAFKPLIVDGRKRRFWIEIPIRFTLH